MTEITLNTQKYQFADCPKCGRRRPISPVSGLCWSCGRHDLDLRLSGVDPLLKEILNDLVARMQIETDPKELLRLILLAEAWADKI
jgi:hypothetical protein